MSQDTQNCFSKCRKEEKCVPTNIDTNKVSVNLKKTTLKMFYGDENDFNMFVGENIQNVFGLVTLNINRNFVYKKT